VTARVASDLGEFADDWNRLALRSASPFLTREWLSSWWSAFGRGEPTWILVSGDKGRLRAGALLEAGPRSRVAAAANVHSGDWDAVARDADAGIELWDTLAALGASRIRLDAMPAHAEGARLAAAALERAGYRLVRVSRDSPWVALPSNWDDLLAGVSRGLRSQFRRRHRALEREAPLVLRTETGSRAVGEDLDAFFRLEAAGWKGRAGTAILSDSRTERLYREFAAGAAEAGWFRMRSLELGGELIAAEYGCTFGGGGFLIKTAFNEAYASFSPGLVLRGEVLKACIDEGLRFYDFLGGPDEYKHRWTSELRPRVTLWAYRGTALPGYVYRARLRPVLRATGGPALKGLREWVKRPSARE